MIKSTLKGRLENAVNACLRAAATFGFSVFLLGFMLTTAGTAGMLTIWGNPNETSVDLMLFGLHLMGPGAVILVVTGVAYMAIDLLRDTKPKVDQ